MEYIKDDLDNFPVVRTMSEMAGIRAMLTAAELLTSTGGGKGILLGGISGVPSAKVVILGAGIVAENATRVALGLGAEVRIFDNFSSGHRENLAAVASRVEVIEGDIRNLEALERAARGMDLISHQAAQLEIFRANSDPGYDLDVNTKGTLNVLEAAKRQGIKRIINASSACVYGQAQGMTAEEASLTPNWEYGVSKLAAEKYTEFYHRAQGLDVVNLRYAIVYGEREWYRRVLTIFVKRALLGQPLVIFGEGEQVRDFVHVSDVVRLHNACLDRPGCGGRAYNVGTGVATTVAMLARAVRAASGGAVDIVHENTPEGDYSKLVPDKRRNTAELGSMWLDISRARADLGWSPQITLEEGLRRSLRWARENTHRWGPIRYSEAAADSKTTKISELISG
jgi:UDP-glucose 4-epimerase